MWYRQSQTKEKKLYIMRGISGSGKSTLAKQLAGENGYIFSTDDYFTKNNIYNFDPTELGQAHNWNLQRSIKAMEEGLSPIIIDNTNTQAWEFKKYIEAGLKHGYSIEIKEPETEWKFNAEELAKRNTHGVPKTTIEKMLNRWEPDLTIEDILNSEKK